MRVPGGRRDTLITIQSRQTTKDPVYKTNVTTWADLADTPQEWAEVKDVLPSRAERIADGIDIQKRPTRIRMEWRADITSDMRIKIPATEESPERTLRIIAGPAELGRRAGLELVCEELTTEGEAP